MRKRKRQPNRRHKPLKHNFDIELDLHGMDALDAERELQKAIYSGKYGTILVVHGHGTGVLKRTIREFLSNNTFISGFDTGENLNFPGGDGVTIVYV